MAEVGAEAGAARDLVDAVGADRARADALELRARRVLHLLVPWLRLLSSRRRRPAPRARSCRSRCSGTGCRPASSAPRSRSGSGFFSSSALAATRKPGVQMPHCSAACSRNFCCSGCSASPLAMPSMVSIDLPLRLARPAQAGADQPAVERDAARAAVAGGAAFLGAGQAQLVAQHVEQRVLRLAQELDRVAVDRCRRCDAWPSVVPRSFERDLGRPAGEHARDLDADIPWCRACRRSGWQAARAAASSCPAARPSSSLAADRGPGPPRPPAAAARATAPSDTRAAVHDALGVERSGSRPRPPPRCPSPCAG